MSDIEKKLRAELLELGVTAPKSWKEQKLASELEKEKEKGSSEKKSGTDTGNTTEAGTDIGNTSDAGTDIGNTSEAKTKQTTTDKAKTPSLEELDKDLVEVIAVADFSNERLKIKRMQPTEKAKFSAADAKFLVDIDRTCKYVK